MNSPNNGPTVADENTNKPATPVTPIVNAPGDKPGQHGPSPSPSEAPVIKADTK